MGFSPIFIAAAVAVTAAAASLGVFFHHFRKRVDPETRRRNLIDSQGRIIEGFVVDSRAGVVIYTWSWRGVDYEASQDIRALQHRMPLTDALLIGPASVKFLPRDPSNSIVISENWSGFRTGSRI